jgi:hypothetical protein
MQHVTARLVQKEVREMLLDHGALVPEVDDEFVDAIMEHL